MVLIGINIGKLRKFVAGLTVSVITVLSFVTSLYYNLATALSITEVLKDAAVLLFLNDLDDHIYVSLKYFTPKWIKNVESSVKSGDDDNDDQSLILMNKISNLERINERLQISINDLTQEVRQLHEQDNECSRKSNLNDLVKSAVQDKLQDFQHENEELKENFEQIKEQFQLQKSKETDNFKYKED